MNVKEFRDIYRRVMDEVLTVIIGQDHVLHLLFTAILAEGHVILTGVPGLGRTLIAETLGKVLGLQIKRIQFTPDLLPTDVTGTEVIQLVDGVAHYKYVPGPIFANMVLADEINRAPARTQSSLLEAMQEKQVTAAGTRYVLERPFLVVATQNSLDTEGVYRLPEAQLDRFMMQIEIRYPSEEAEIGIIDATTSTYHAEPQVVTDPKKLVEMQDFAKNIPVPQSVKEFAAKLVRESRWEGEKEVVVKKRGKLKWNWLGLIHREEHKEHVAQFVRWGASPRAGQALLRAGKVSAIVKGRTYVAREDIMEMAYPVLAHRVIPDHRAGAKGLTSTDVVSRLVNEVCEETTPQPVSSRMKRLLVPVSTK